MYKIIIRSLVVSAALIFGAAVMPGYAKTDVIPMCQKPPYGKSAKYYKLYQSEQGMPIKASTLFPMVCRWKYDAKKWPILRRFLGITDKQITGTPVGLLALLVEYKLLGGKQLLAKYKQMVGSGRQSRPIPHRVGVWALYLCWRSTGRCVNAESSQEYFRSRRACINAANWHNGGSTTVSALYDKCFHDK